MLTSIGLLGVHRNCLVIQLTDWLCQARLFRILGWTQKRLTEQPRVWRRGIVCFGIHWDIHAMVVVPDRLARAGDAVVFQGGYLGNKKCDLGLETRSRRMMVRLCPVDKSLFCCSFLLSRNCIFWYLMDQMVSRCYAQLVVLAQDFVNDGFRWQVRSQNQVKEKGAESLYIDSFFLL